MKKLPVDVLEEKARVLTKEALEACEIPDDLNLPLGMRLDGDERVFELCRFSDGKKETKADPIAEARLNVYTGEGSVKTFLPMK